VVGRDDSGEGFFYLFIDAGASSTTRGQFGISLNSAAFDAPVESAKHMQMPVTYSLASLSLVTLCVYLLHGTLYTTASCSTPYAPREASHQFTPAQHTHIYIHTSNRNRKKLRTK
jgi:hypothetical protein